MDFSFLTPANITAWVTALSTVGGVVFGVYKYFTGRDRQIAIRAAFQNVVSALSSENPVQRQAAAILLRRFLDPQTELGQKDTPYAGEAISVITAILRTEQTGEFQKLLADGLREAETLERVDLQRTNLQNAYLGMKKGDKKPPNLSNADFYRADLGSASLKGADLKEAVFYQACLHNTTMRDSNLTGANFYEADLLGANLRGAVLTGANFGQARNLPEGLEPLLNDSGTYEGTEPFAPPAVDSGKRAQVFLSKPGVLSARQMSMVSKLKEMLAAEDLGVVTMERGGYPSFSPTSHIRREIQGCAGTIVLGFRQLEVDKGHWRSETDEATDMAGVALPTSWNHIEAGMATMAGMPLLCINEEGVTGGMFGFEDIDNAAFEVNLDRLDVTGLAAKLSDWSLAVREAAR